MVQLVFGYMLSSIGSLVATLDRQAALSEEKMDAIKAYMRWRRMPRDLSSRVRRYYEFYYEQRTAFDEVEILEGLTPPLRLEVVYHALKETIGRMPLFRCTLDAAFQLEIFPLLKPLSSAPKELVYTRGEPSTLLFFLIKGQAEAVCCHNMGSRVLFHIKQHHTFGESVLTGSRRAETVRAHTWSEMFTISSSDLKMLFEAHPRQGTLMHQELLREHKRKTSLREASLREVCRSLSIEGSVKNVRNISALKLQMLWHRVYERMACATTPLDHPSDFGDTLDKLVAARIVAPPGVVQLVPPSPRQRRNSMVAGKAWASGSLPRDEHKHDQTHSPTRSECDQTSGRVVSFAPGAPETHDETPSDFDVRRQCSRSSTSPDEHVLALHDDVRKILSAIGDLTQKLGAAQVDVERAEAGPAAQMEGLRPCPPTAVSSTEWPRQF